MFPGGGVAMTCRVFRPNQRRAPWYRSLRVELLERRDVPSFLAPPAYAAGSSPSAVIARDFNGDGLPDVAVTNQTTAGLVSVLLNTGGGFGTPTQFRTAGSNPSSLAVGGFHRRWPDRSRRHQPIQQHDRLVARHGQWHVSASLYVLSGIVPDVGYCGRFRRRRRFRPGGGQRREQRSRARVTQHGNGSFQLPQVYAIGHAGLCR